MFIMDIKSIVAKNIAELRKSNSLTQIELSQKLNYSDKAVSKWERAESLPDVTVLKEIADLFCVTVDYLLEEQHDKQKAVSSSQVIRQKKNNQVLITLISTSLVFLIATTVYVVLRLFSVELPIWMAYIYAIPVASVVLIVFNSIWGKRIWNFVFVTILVWTILLSMYLSIRAENMWLIFLIGIPAQVIILLWGRLKFRFK